MTPLATLQRAVQAFLLEGGAPPAALVEAVAAPAGERWTIYRDAYRIRLVEALAAAYPGLAARLGEDFGLAVIGYVLEHPSTFRSVRDYGATLPEWLAASADDPEGRLRAELAALDRALGDAFDAADVATVAATDLAAVAPAAWPGLRFGFAPGCAVIALTTNAADVRADPALAVAEWPRAQRLAWRVGEDVHHRTLPADEAAALADAMAGRPFATLCETLEAHHGDAAPARAAALLGRWLADGIVATVRAG